MPLVLAQIWLKLKMKHPSRERRSKSAAVRRTMQQANRLISPGNPPGQCTQNSGGGELHSITRLVAPKSCGICLVGGQGSHGHQFCAPSSVSANMSTAGPKPFCQNCVASPATAVNLDL